MGKDDWKIAFKAAFKAADEAEKQAKAKAEVAETARAKAQAEKLAQDKIVTEQAAELKKLTANPKINPKKQIKTAETAKAEAETASEAAGKLATEQDAEAVDQRKKEETARKEKETAVYEAHSDYSQALKKVKRRLAAARDDDGGISAKLLDGHFKKLEEQLAKDMGSIEAFEKLFAELEATEKTVLTAMAPAKAKPLQDRCTERFEALKKLSGTFMPTPDRKEIGALLEASALAIGAGKHAEAMISLDQKIVPLLDGAEGAVKVYDALLADVRSRETKLATDEFHHAGKLDGASQKRKNVTGSLHKVPLAESCEALAQAEGALAEAEEHAAQNRRDGDAYLRRRVEVMKEIDAFKLQHKGFAKECENKVERDCVLAGDATAFGKAGTRDCANAMNLLDEALEVLAGLVAKAEAKAKSLGDAAQAAAALKAQQEAKAKAQAKAEADKKAAESALVPASLTAIGKNRIGQWVYQLNRLLTEAKPAVVRIQGGRNPFELPNIGAVSTWEARCEVVDVAAGTVIDYFVVHYHPDLKAKDMTGANASRIHAKPVRGNATTPHLHMHDDNHWLVADGHVLGFSAVRNMA